MFSWYFFIKHLERKLPSRTFHSQPSFLHSFPIDVNLGLGSLGQKLPEKLKISLNPQRFPILASSQILWIPMDRACPARRETVGICILLLLVNLLDFLLDLSFTPRPSLELLNCQPKAEVLVGVFFLHVGE